MALTDKIEQRKTSRRNFLKIAGLSAAATAIFAGGVFSGNLVGKKFFKTVPRIGYASYEEWANSTREEKTRRARAIYENPQACYDSLTEKEKQDFEQTSREIDKRVEDLKKIAEEEAKGNIILFPYGLWSNKPGILGATKEGYKVKYGVDVDFENPSLADRLLMFYNNIHERRQNKETMDEFRRKNPSN